MAFAANPMPQKTLGDLGLAMLLETVPVEGFLSRVSDQIGDALTRHYQIADDAGVLHHSFDGLGQEHALGYNEAPGEAAAPIAPPPTLASK